MKPLLWRIAGCVLFLLPIAALAWLLLVLFGPLLGWLVLAIAASFVGAILVCALFSLGAICFDKAKRPPR